MVPVSLRRASVLVSILALALAGLAGPAAHAVHTCPAAASAAGTPTWPPAPAAGSFDIAHFGEGHWNEGQGPKTMPILVQEIVSHHPAFVAFSSDMADNGFHDQLECFRQLMSPLLAAGIPWFDSPGNHDRRNPVFGSIGVDIAPWREVFAGMPKPWGDAPKPGRRYVVPEPEPDDGPGAATHYYFDFGPPHDPAVRLIVIDNSVGTITNSDLFQFPPVGPGMTDASQFAFMKRAAEGAQAAGLLAFVMMHIPTQDPRDITNAHPVSYNHTMGKSGEVSNNVIFDALALTSGVDAVLLGHIQGNVVYEFGGVRYFVDGGGGGSPYALREVGTDTGYYYGFRLIRVFPSGTGWSFRSYFLPLVDHIEMGAPPASVAVGDTVALQATAVQPFDLTLPRRLPLLLWDNEAFRLPLRPPDPSRIDAATVPHLAYMWSTSNPAVLAPVPGPDDPVGDPAFNAATMTTSGKFTAGVPGTATITVATGTHSASVAITVG